MAEQKKQVPLRLNAKLYDALAAWAEDDFRSVNGQIEYLLTECVRQRKKNQPRLWKVVFHSRGRLRLCDRKT